MKRLIVILPLIVSACVQPPSSPAEASARKAAGAELVAKNCAGFAGGFASVRELRAAGNREIATARGLGATDALIQKARQDVQTAFSTMEGFTSRQEACNSMIGELAWALG